MGLWEVPPLNPLRISSRSYPISSQKHPMPTPLPYTPTLLLFQLEVINIITQCVNFFLLLELNVSTYKQETLDHNFCGYNHM